jgi:hypothetical protein
MVFGLFGLLSLTLMLNVSNYRGGFKPADVDVLFPTPVSPKLNLIFRIVRDTLVTLLLPLLFALIGWQGVNVGISAFFRNFPQYGNFVFRASFAAWLLMSLSWVCIGYAVSLFVNRSDLQSDRNRRALAWVLGALIVGVGAYIALSLRTDFSWNMAYALAHDPFLRATLFTATAATVLVMAPLHGSLVELGAGLGGFALILFASIRLALTQVGWMYDQAAAKGFEAGEFRSLQRKGDVYGMMAHAARSGKLKDNPVARRLARWSPRGARALVWKETVLTLRVNWMTILMNSILVTFMVAMPVWAAAATRPGPIVPMFYGMHVLGVFIGAVSLANVGFAELLRRVDLQKPLPFSPMAIVSAEVAAKVAIPWMSSVIASVVAVSLSASLAQHALVAFVLVPSIAFLFTAIALLVTVLAPDLDDPTQRGYRGFLMVLGLATLSLPGAGAFIGLWIAGLPPGIACIPAIVLNGLIGFAVLAVASNLYASFNPSE